MRRHLLEGLNGYFRGDIYKRLLPYARPYKLPMGIVVGITVLQAGLGLLEPWPLALIVDSGLGDQHLPDWLKAIFPFLASESGHIIIIFSVVLGIVVNLVGKLLDVIGNYIKSVINEGM